MNKNYHQKFVWVHWWINVNIEFIFSCRSGL